MSLYNKYRPKTLAEIIGNKETTLALEGMLKKPKTSPHSFMLSGATGCGKTTIGRIIGNILETSDADFREIDSADFRGIDTIREIRKNCQFKPLESNFRIYLLDECHQLSKDAQNALLKILEDTPRHVFFILCTTEPQKMLATVKNRCSHFTVNPLSEREMKLLLKRIVKSEKEILSKEIYKQIIDHANGHPRNAIQILEQVLNTDTENRLEASKKIEIVLSESIELAKILLKNPNWKQVAKILKGLKTQEPENIRRAVVGYVQAVLLNGDNEKAGIILEEFIEPFYHTGFPQLVLACYLLTKN